VQRNGSTIEAGSHVDILSILFWTRTKIEAAAEAQDLLQDFCCLYEDLEREFSKAFKSAFVTQLLATTYIRGYTCPVVGL